MQSRPSSRPLIFALAALLTLLASSSGLAEKTSTEFIRTSCSSTTYPRLCIKSLSSYASEIQKSPWQLAHAALSVTLSGARSTSAFFSRLAAQHGLKPGVAGALRDCIETMGDSVDELRQSIAEIKHLSGPDFDLRMNNIQTWVSAALTDEDTCTDGFAGAAMDGKINTVVRRHITAVAKMTSNALALVNNLASSSTPTGSP
ncbi:hypothetical protein ACLOJK_033428 [Asimina triloba]